MSYQAILFDLDGTLIETPELWAEAYSLALAEFGRELPMEKFWELYPLGIHVEEWLEDLGIDRSHTAQLRESRDRHYEELLRTQVDWIAGAEEVFHSICKNYPTGIITGSHKSYIDAIEEKIDIRRHTGAFIDSNELPKGRGKPCPDGLLLACKRLDVDPTECIYIGDMAVDMEAAKAAQMVSCFIECPHMPSVTDKADFVIKDIKEFPELL